MDTTEALKGGRLDDALAAAKDAVRKSPSDPKHRSVLFQLYCMAGQWDAAVTQLKLVSEFDMEAMMWVGVCEKLLSCEADRREVFAGKKPPTLFGKPPEWVGGMIEAFRLGLENQWPAAAASAATALEAAPATPATIDGQEAAWVADGDSRFGPMLEAFVDGRYYWIPFEHVREVHFRGRTHLMDSIWAPADFQWLNEGQAAGYVPVRYPGSESSADPLLRLGRKTEWHEAAENYYCGSGHRALMTDAAELGLAEVKLIRFSHPEAKPAEPAAAPAEPAEPAAGDV